MSFACRPDCPHCATYCTTCGEKLLPGQPDLDHFHHATGEPLYIVTLLCPNQPRGWRGRPRKPWHSTSRHYAEATEVV